MSLRPMTVRQAVSIMMVIVILWIPMATFLVFYSHSYSQRQIALIALANLLVGVSLLIFVYRRWMSKVR